MKKIYTVDPGTARERVVAVERDEEGRRAVVTLDHGQPGARTFEIDAARTAQGGMSLLWRQNSYEVDCVEREDIWSLLIRGQVFDRHVLDQRKLRMAMAAGQRLGGSDPSLKTPMAGRVVALLVAPGQAVEEGQGVVIIEAMKMENEIKAHRAGLVGAIKVAPGDTVEADQLLATIDDAHEG